MDRYAAYIMEATFTAIVLAAIITHSTAFVKMINAGSGALVGSVQALWGPQAGKK